MKKIKTIIFLIILFAYKVSISQIDTVDVKDLFAMSLDEIMDIKITVTAARHEQDVLLVAATVNTISANDIKLSSATNLADILRIVPGITISCNPGGLPRNKIILRGFSSIFMNERTLIMIDGLPVYHPSGGGIDPGLISLSNVKKIEIIKGPVSALYGANAFGGIINVITKSGSEGFLAEVESGMKMYTHLDNDKTVITPVYSVNLSGKQGIIDYFISADGFLNNDGYMEVEKTNRDDVKAMLPFGEQTLDFYGKIGFQFNEKTKLSISGLLSKDQNHDGYDYIIDPLENDIIRTSVNLTSKITDNYTIKVQGYFNDFKNYFEYEDERIDYDNQAQTIGIDIQNTLKIKDNHIIVFGGDIRNDKSKMSTKYHDYSAGYPPPAEPAGWDEKTTQNYSFYIQEEYLGINKLHPSLGIRFDYYTGFGSAFSPRFGLSYELFKNSAVYLTAAKAFRAPNFNELYITGFGKLGNTDLEPEYSTMYEIGYKSTMFDEKTHFNLSVFHHNINNIITLQNIDTTTSRKDYVNFGEGKIKGIETEISHNFPLGITPFFNMCILWTENNKGEKINKVPETKLAGGVNFNYKGFNMKFNITDISEHRYNSSRIDKITKLDLYLSKTFLFNKYLEKINIATYVDNLTNEKYREVYSKYEVQTAQRLPGRTLGIKLKCIF